MVVGTADRTAEVASRRWLPARTPDVAVPVGYLALAVWLTHRQWGRPDRLFHQAGDQILFEWMLARAARAVAGLENPLWSDALNAPGGVNLMANTSVLGLGVPLAPVTLLLGSQAAFVVAVVLCLAGTATAWYVLLRRRLVDSWPAAAVGGLVCGFAPGMIAQAGTHLHMAAQFLVPLILALVFRPEPGGRVWRHGVLLGLVVTYQVFLGEEVLLFVALAAGVLVGAYAIADPSAARRLAPSTAGRIGVGALVAGVLLAYPLWFQFFGPGHYRGMPFHAYSYQLDAASFTRFARQTLFGVDRPPGLLAPNPTEENSFFGVGLLLLAVVVAVWLRRRPLVRALAACGLVFALLSLGPRVRLDGRATDLPGPYRLIAELPLLDHVVPARFALVCIPVLGVLIALGVDRWVRRTAVDTAPAGPRRRATVRLVGVVALAVALLPLVPTPIRTVSSRPVPAFVADGTWRTYVPAGRTLVPVPIPSNVHGLSTLRWSALTQHEFPIPAGYFIGPNLDGEGVFGAPNRPTSTLVYRSMDAGEVPELTDENRQQAVEDLRFWRASVVVLGAHPREAVLRDLLTGLLGEPQRVDDVWLWDVRDRV
ncbi:hypothetical protein EYA84_13325 [Verrucosispora sp. SN26_14.1]|uniref:hypothetical protein n=1 Tax=Verrucosispora sp. SN26_14.1 TaxID=2527879 RepID=UPI0010349382|nr:hypothetical protein [Verrucosispora sp. SN26_14.1]TBL35802.1 hypothetical protein EYA84_13325 [Verrucosispora sp. SN26_14.1]